MKQLCALTLAVSAFAWGFDSGSNGSYGPITLIANEQRTLQVPDDGVFHATTVTIPQGAALRFGCNARNTPITILASGDITINGSIDIRGGAVSISSGGLGGCGGFPGGAPRQIGQSIGSDGRGPGGGAASAIGAGEGGQFGSGAGAYGSSVLLPLIGGSGGGSSILNNTAFGGGGGGGAILLVSSSRISVNFSAQGVNPINACGGDGPGGWGSGGAVRLVSRRVDGNGWLCVDRCNLCSTISGQNATAQAGRIRIDTLDRTGLQLQSNAGTPMTIGSVMQLSLPNAPRIEITNVAGNDIPTNSGSVLISLPPSAPAMQPVTLRATGFTGTVPVRLVLTPLNGPRVTVDGEIVMGTQSSAMVTLSASLPGNSTVALDAWTR